MNQYLIQWFDAYQSSRVTWKQEVLEFSSLKKAKAHATNNGQNRQNDVDIHLLYQGVPVECVAVKRLQCWLTPDGRGLMKNKNGLTTCQMKSKKR
jgi:hypothetical protein